MMRKMFLAATAIALVFGATAASAQQGGAPPPGNDPYGYYSQYDHDGYYGRDGRYVRYDNQTQSGPDQGQGYDNGPPPGYDNGPPPGYDNGPPPDSYREGYCEDHCRRGNTAAGTIFGALAGGLIGGAASHGNGGAVVGGAILGGLFGNAISHDIPCEDHRYAVRVYAQGLDGPLGQRSEWRNSDNDDYGYFTPQREFTRDGYVCRSFSTTTYRDGQPNTRSGTACRMRDGNWRFD